MKAKITLNDKIIEFPLKRCSSWDKFKGLMFSRNHSPLLIEIKDKPIHSMFVFYPFLALWLNDENTIVDYKMINPFTSSVIPQSSFSKIIEIPYKGEFKDIIDGIIGQKDLNINPT
ncbi:hypothetical protein HYV49_00330 [Candidatus Pacearchaeota archaeon]|nr:hypothetical protein [Candidatus Pacearchaeota archaeon]